MMKKIIISSITILLIFSIQIGVFADNSFDLPSVPNDYFQLFNTNKNYKMVFSLSAGDVSILSTGTYKNTYDKFVSDYTANPQNYIVFFGTCSTTFGLPYFYINTAGNIIFGQKSTATSATELRAGIMRLFILHKSIPFSSDTYQSVGCGADAGGVQLFMPSYNASTPYGIRIDVNEMYRHSGVARATTNLNFPSNLPPYANKSAYFFGSNYVPSNIPSNQVINNVTVQINFDSSIQPNYPTIENPNTPPTSSDNTSSGGSGGGDNNGNINCPNCNPGGSGGDSSCPSCGGSGFVHICPPCNGSGGDCPNCGGSGYLPNKPPTSSDNTSSSTSSDGGGGAQPPIGGGDGDNMPIDIDGNLKWLLEFLKQNVIVCFGSFALVFGLIWSIILLIHYTKRFTRGA